MMMMSNDLLMKLLQILQLFGAFLAWETRQVQVAALNDSKYIGMSLYNVTIMCVLGVGIQVRFYIPFCLMCLCFILLTAVGYCLQSHILLGFCYSSSITTALAFSRVGEIFFDPNIQLDLTYVCIFIVKKC